MGLRIHPKEVTQKSSTARVIEGSKEVQQRWTVNKENDHNVGDLYITFLFFVMKKKGDMTEEKSIFNCAIMIKLT